MHIVEVLALPVHHILEVKAGADGTVKLFIVLTGIAYLPHTGSVHHGRLCDLGEYLLLRLPFDKEIQIDTLASLYQRGQPAGTDRGGVAISRDVKVGMVHAIDDDVVLALGVHGSRCKNVENGCGACLQLRKIRLFLAEDHALQKRLVRPFNFTRLFLPWLFRRRLL